MMESVWLAVLCLSGWFILPSCPLRQYHFVNVPLTWREAQTYCRERFTDLATIENREEMNQLINTVSSSGINSNVWIGAYSEVNWKWSDGLNGSEAEFRKWRTDEPNYFLSQLCVSTTRSGEWANLNCLKHVSFICYKGTQLDPVFVLVRHSISWSRAQKYCREKFIDLATVRNDNENQEIQSLVSSHGYAWLGLSRDPNFHWSDGSSFFFSNFNDGASEYGSRRILCGAASLSSSGKWRFLSCDQTLPFVCYSPPVSKQVVKLRIKLDDSSVDPNDPAVKAELLKKLQDRLKEEGVSGASLKWREQPDGKVWHKEDL